MSYDAQAILYIYFHSSQSLWNRAMSYFLSIVGRQKQNLRLNPFGTGQCLTTSISEIMFSSTFRLNPFGTGQCLTTYRYLFHSQLIYLSQSLWNRAMSYDIIFILYLNALRGLNPFGTGQCLTTWFGRPNSSRCWVSIPLEQGNVLRPQKKL